MASAGFQVVSFASVERAVHRVLRHLDFGQELPTRPVTDLIPVDEKRNAEVYQRYVNGERAVDLAEKYGISLQRIYVLIHRYQSSD